VPLCESFLKKLPLEESVKEAIKYCIDNNILKEYLEKRKGDVMSLLYYEYDHDLALEVTRKEAREQGLEEGLEQAARNALAEGASIEFVQKITGFDIEAIKALIAKG
jgi:hypothetical protein